MMEFWTALSQYAFLQYALLGGLLASLACGVIGTYVVIRRISYLAGAVAHSVLAGLGGARYAQVVLDWQWLTPFTGAIIAGLLAALLVGLVNLKAKQREDTIISAIWAMGMALGILFISQTPGYDTDLMNYLFGNILLLNAHDLWLLLGLDVVVCLIGLALRPQISAVCFDYEFARLRGLPADFYYLLLLMLTALTVVILSALVGVIMVIALLTLPAAVAGHFTRRLGPMMLLAIICCALFSTAGLALSYGPDLPSGAFIILLAGGCYLLTAFGTKLLKKRGQRPEAF